MVRSAQQFFDFASTDSIKLHVADGRVLVRLKLLTDERYDIIILVAFGKDWTPEHLSTQEFLLEVKDLMGENAVFVAHSRARNRLRDSLFRFTRVSPRSPDKFALMVFARLYLLQSIPILPEQRFSLAYLN